MRERLEKAVQKFVAADAAALLLKPTLVRGAIGELLVLLRQMVERIESLEAKVNQPSGVKHDDGN